MYDGLSTLKPAGPSSSVCSAAYQFNLAFLITQYAMLAIAAALFVVAVYTTYYSPRDWLGSVETPSPLMYLVGLAFGSSKVLLWCRIIPRCHFPFGPWGEPRHRMKGSSRPSADTFHARVQGEARGGQGASVPGVHDAGRLPGDAPGQGNHGHRDARRAPGGRGVGLDGSVGRGDSKTSFGSAPQRVMGA
jgi:hypothetical protein